VISADPLSKPFDCGVLATTIVAVMRRQLRARAG
jgi:hypothetical protein